MKFRPKISNNRSRRRGGFSLAEVLIAMGIFGIGMALTAALFPAGADQTKTSVNNVIGPMMCQNGLSIIKTRLKHSTNPYTTTTMAYFNDSIPVQDRNFPSGATTSILAYRFAGRRMTSGENDYQFVIVACRKADALHSVTMQTKSGTISDSGDVSKVTFSNTSYLQLGTPVIVKSASGSLVGGEWAWVTALDGTTATLSHRITATSGSIDLFVVYEAGLDSYQRCPAISVLVARTPLSE